MKSKIVLIFILCLFLLSFVAITSTVLEKSVGHEEIISFKGKTLFNSELYFISQNNEVYYYCSNYKDVVRTYFLIQEGHPTKVVVRGRRILKIIK